jgi:hypothetical protein
MVPAAKISGAFINKVAKPTITCYNCRTYCVQVQKAQLDLTICKSLSDVVENCACLVQAGPAVQQPTGPPAPAPANGFNPSDAIFLSPAIVQQPGASQPVGVPSGVPQPPVFQPVSQQPGPVQHVGVPSRVPQPPVFQPVAQQPAGSPPDWSKVDLPL